MRRDCMCSQEGPLEMTRDAYCTLVYLRTGFEGYKRLSIASILYRVRYSIISLIELFHQPLLIFNQK